MKIPVSPRQIRQVRVDWPRVLADLRAHGVGPADIGRACDLSTVSLYHYAESHREPSHVNGETLICLWLHVTGRPRAEIPRRSLTRVSAAIGHPRMHAASTPHRVPAAHDE